MYDLKYHLYIHLSSYANLEKKPATGCSVNTGSSSLRLVSPHKLKHWLTAFVSEGPRGKLANPEMLEFEVLLVFVFDRSASLRILKYGHLTKRPSALRFTSDFPLMTLCPFLFHASIKSLCDITRLFS